VPAAVAAAVLAAVMAQAASRLMVAACRCCCCAIFVWNLPEEGTPVFKDMFEPVLIGKIEPFFSTRLNISFYMCM
jgi:hypothetical protein